LYKNLKMEKKFEFVYGRLDDSKNIKLEYKSAQERRHNSHKTINFIFNGIECKRINSFNGREVSHSKFDWLVNDRLVSSDYHVWLEKEYNRITDYGKNVKYEIID
jgi:hypothetical protein